MRRASAPHGFTLVETMIACAVFAIVGMMIFLVLNTGMVLYAKNTSINSAHQQARSGIDQMLSNIHSAVSIPQQVHVDLTPFSTAEVAAKAKSAGIAFQKFEAGPFPVVNRASAGDTSIILYMPVTGYTLPANVRLNIPSHGIEVDVTGSAGLWSYRRFDFATPLSTDVNISGTGIEGGGATKYVITAFLTTRVAYAVAGNELRYYPTNDPASYTVITRNVTNSSSTPFSIPTLSSGESANRYVAAVDLSTEESHYNNRGYAAVNMFISSLIPYRCRLTNQQ
jgi:prepilin-type N-terminal cleavage/methylation domain-containing protein